MPPVKKIRKTTKRKTVPKKEVELKAELAPAPESVQVPDLVHSSESDSTPIVDSNDSEKEPVNIETTTAYQYETRLDNLSSSLTLLMKTIKELNLEVKDIKKELVKELKKRDKTKKKKSSINRPPSGFAKPTELTPELCEFMGIEKGSLKARTQVTKFFCEYFKTHNLQNPEYKRNIIPNEPLKNILNLKDDDEVSYFNLQKYLKIHYPKKQ